MKVHNDLKELLEDYTQKYFDKYFNSFPRVQSKFIESYLSSNSLALDEAQAVRQNEDAKSNFICYHFENGNVSAKCHKPCGDRCCLAV